MELRVGLAWDTLSGNMKRPACLVRCADARLAGGELKEMPYPGLLPGKHGSISGHAGTARQPESPRVP